MLHRLMFWTACLAAGCMPLLTPAGGRAPAAAVFPGWPRSFEGRPLVQVPLTDADRRFAADFPGRLGRFRADGRTVLLRWVPEPTRRLHPAADCFRGSGYRMVPLPVWAAPDGTRWGCGRADRGTEQLRVRERIVDAGGGAWTDISSWYWAALLGRSRGPWWAVTIVEPA
jgi:hypothetical protein